MIVSSYWLIHLFQLLLRQKQEEEHSEQLSETIIKFRKKTAELNGEMEDLKDQVPSRSPFPYLRSTHGIPLRANGSIQLKKDQSRKKQAK